MKKLKQICTTLCLLFFCNAIVSSMSGSKPSFTEKPKEVRCNVGQPITFRISAIGFPIPDLRVYKGDAELSTGGRYNIYKTGTGKYIFEIEKTERIDNGYYTFVLRNENGIESVRVKLIVLDPKS